MRDGHNLEVRQGEVALTDYLLLEIARARLPSIRLVKTPQNQESSRGTDWEWWIGSHRAGWLRYAVQAKRLLFPKDLYDALGHKVLRRRQVDILIDYARANRAVPLYCFYNCTNEPNAKQYWHCNLPFELEQFGCTVAPARVVKTALARRGQRTFQFIHGDPRVLPWRCLVRCPYMLSVYQAGRSGQAPFPLLGENERVVIHAGLPRQLEIGLETGELREFEPDFFQGPSEYYPRHLAVIDLTASLESAGLVEPLAQG